MDKKIILAIDTTSKISSICIKKGNKIFLEEDKSGVTHSKTLVPMLINMIEKNNIDINEIKDVIVCVGPGSFTGIRIGIASVKGLIFKKDINVIEITSLELLARNVTNELRKKQREEIEKKEYQKLDDNNSTKYIISNIDAKNNQLYYGIYIFEDDKLIKDEEAAGSKEELIRKIKENIIKTKKPIYIVGNSITKEDLSIENEKQNLQNEQIIFFNNNEQTTLSAMDKYLELEKYDMLKDKYISEKEILPNYLKKSQAQKLKDQSKGKENDK